MGALTYEIIKEAVIGSTSAFRAVTELAPIAPGDKIFPPTYEGGEYATETRVIDGRRVPCVLLDSVQSEANRMELALLDAFRSRKVEFPFIQVDFAGTDAAEAAVLTALETPHRIVDAIFMACEIQENGKRVPFRHKNPEKSSEVGKRIDRASPTNATALFELCPTSLLFGMWDSHGSKGGLGEKFQRALTSEIIGIDVETGVRPASRIDPLIRTTSGVRIDVDGEGSWNLSEKGKKKLSEVGLGNVTPSLRNADTGQMNHGGFTISSARQITVLSLPALRRLRFPIKGKAEEETNVVAQSTLAALGFVAVTQLWRMGFDLRSRCVLDPQGPPVFEKIDKGTSERFELTADDASRILQTAARESVEKGFGWEKNPLTLYPSERLVQVVKKSREMAKAESA